MKIKTNKKSGKLILASALLAVLIFSHAVIFASCGVSVAATSGNVSNYGYLLSDGNDIYYTKVIVENESAFFSNIYKYNIRTEEEILISSMPAAHYTHMNAFLSLDGGYLYFLANFIHDTSEEFSDNIYRIKPDGKNTVPEKLFEENISCAFMYISNGTIYYYDDSDNIIYRMNTNGTNKKILCEAYVTGIAVGPDKIYFADDDMLMSVSVNGGEPKEIYDFEDDDIYIESLVLDGNYLYYLNDEESLIGRIKTDGTDKKDVYKVSESSYAYIERFNVSGGVVYFVLDEYGPDDNYAILSVVPGSKSTKVIVDDKQYELGDIGPLSIWNDTIYFVGMPIYDTVMDSDDVWFKVKIGGKTEAFKPFNVFK